MANRKTFYFRQKVTDSELNEAFDDLEVADRNIMADLGMVGILANANVSEHSPIADLTVDVSGPAIIYDQNGERIFFSTQNVSIAVDNNGVPTDVSSADQEKIVSIFVKFDRDTSEPRIDGNSRTINYREDESFKFIIVQGAQVDKGGAIPPPLMPNAILLADITRQFNQSQIMNSNISLARRQDAIAVSGLHPIRRGRIQNALADLAAIQIAHFSGANDRHPAQTIDFTPSGNLSSKNVQDALGELDNNKAGLGTNNTFNGTQVIKNSLQVDNDVTANGIIHCSKIEPLATQKNLEIVSDSCCKASASILFKKDGCSLVAGMNIGQFIYDSYRLFVNYVEKINNPIAVASTNNGKYYPVLNSNPDSTSIALFDHTKQWFYGFQDLEDEFIINLIVFGINN